MALARRVRVPPLICRFVLAAALTTSVTSAARADWIDVKTGQRVANWPSIGGRVIRGDRDRAFDPETGRNFARDECGNWIDTKTGQRVADWPSIGGRVIRGDRDRAFDPETGRNFARQPCPPTQQAKTTPPPPAEHSSTIKLDPASAQMLAMQNAARIEIGVPPFQWDPALAASAAAYGPTLVQLGQLVHAPRKGRENERENLSMSPHGVFSAGQLIDRWLSEKRNFIPGIYPNVSRTGDWSDVAHYTQIVWPTTTRVGCAFVPGPSNDFLICRYSPPGNQDGKPVGQPLSISDSTNPAYFPRPEFVVGPPRVGLDVNICSGSSDSQINRHSPGGDLDLDASTNVVLDMLFKCEVSVDTTIAPPPLSETPPPLLPPTPLEPPMR